MDRDRVISILRRYERELKSLGIEHISLFGSTARGARTEGSGVDIAVRLAPGPRGLERLARLGRVEALLTELLEQPVDVIEEPARSPHVQRAIDRDGVPAF